MRTRNQEYALHIYKQVSNIINEDYCDKYGSLAHKLPVLIRTAGLAQALAFVDARGGDAGKALLEHIAGVVGLENREKLIDRSRKADLEEYMHLSRRVLAALVWYKRFAQSVLGVEQDADVGGEL
ncbi:MAG: type III-B CRISPR module-associated protein Cmr5 [Firmicutes bacterium]|nr:type III-B CRISPR module-associated protein Cmr5 [Candidatus Fermentithermobacillaceae bacterium]